MRATPDSVLAECHAVARTGIFVLAEHALQRANERRIGRADIRSALASATAAALQDNGRWLITGGTGLDGESVVLAVSLNRGFVIVTLF